MHFEPLEGRRLLTATIEDRILTIIGTAGADDIRIRGLSDGSNVVIINNTIAGSFQTSDFDQVNLQMGPSSDSFTYVDVPPNPSKLVGNPTALALEKPMHLRGGPGNDTITSSDGNDTLIGGGGDDQLNGAGGNDRIRGKQGNDDLDGSDGDDSLYAGIGDDSLDGGNGDDLLVGRIGADILDLNFPAGADTLRGNAGPDTIYTDDENDLVAGGAGADQIIDV